MKGKLVKLEALRGFAAFYVVAHHLFASGLLLFGIDFSFLFRFGQEAVIYFIICLMFSYLIEKILYPKVNRFVLQKVIK